MIDIAERFSLKKTTFQGKQVRDFHRILKIRSCWKIKTNIITARKTVKLWVLSSVAALKEHKNESGVETNRYKHKKNTLEANLQWILTISTAAPTPRV